MARAGELEISEDKVSVRRLKMKTGRGGLQFGAKVRELEEDDRITFKWDRLRFMRTILAVHTRGCIRK